MKKIMIGFAVLTSLGFLSENAIANESSVQLIVRGHVQAAPAWVDATGRPLSELVFDFGGVLHGGGGDLDSHPVKARLANAISYPATVALVRPADCAVGGRKVKDDGILFLRNNEAFTANGSLTVAGDSEQTFALRFKSMRNASGEVSCVRAGALTYTF